MTKKLEELFDLPENKEFIEEEKVSGSESEGDTMFSNSSLAKSVGISEESHLDPKLELLKMNTVEAKKMEAKLENESLIQKIN